MLSNSVHGKRYKFCHDLIHQTNRNINLIGGGPDLLSLEPAQKLTSEQLENIYKSFNLESIKYDKPAGAPDTLVNSTYGEITFEGVEKLIKEANLNENDIFYDLGSGNGKAVMQIFVNGKVKKAYGIEFHLERFENAETALKKLYKMRPDILDNNRLISYQLQNIKDVPHLTDATVIYMCSTCYPEELLAYVYDKVKNSKNLRCIITHKQYDKFKDFLPMMKTAILPCTWGSQLTWHFYEV